jgi:hypothetical protein
MFDLMHNAESQALRVQEVFGMLLEKLTYSTSLFKSFELSKTIK